MKLRALFLAIMACFTCACMAQQQKPKKYYKDNFKNEKYVKYDVPIINDRVTFTDKLSFPGQTAAELYEKAKLVMKNSLSDCLKEYVSEDANEKKMSVSGEHYFEAYWTSGVYLNRNILFKLHIACEDGALSLNMTDLFGQSISGQQTKGNSDPINLARQIGDFCMNKKKTKMYNCPQAISRIETIDLKERIFNTFVCEMGKSLDVLKGGNDEW